MATVEIIVMIAGVDATAMTIVATEYCSSTNWFGLLHSYPGLLHQQFLLPSPNQHYHY